MQIGFEAIVDVIMLMRLNAKQGCVLLILILFGMPVFGQEKFERERRIREAEVPKPAIVFIDSLCADCKVKWLEEESLNGYSVEAKLKIDRKRYSVEFAPDGSLQDVEIVTDWNTAPQLVKDSLTVLLETSYSKFKVIRAQIQYSGDEQAILQSLGTKNILPEVRIGFELTVKCKNEEGWSLYEYLISSTGELLSKSRIVFKNYSNLEY